MRNKLRIPIVLEKILISTRLRKFLKTENQSTINLIYDNWIDITEYWNNNPDQRFGQMLSNLNLVDKEVENIIWNIEEDSWLIKNGYCNIEDIRFWGVTYYKNGKKRKTIKFKLLKDLETDHIKNIIRYFEDQNALHRLNKEYLEYFNKRINT